MTESGSHEEVDAKLDDTHALDEYLKFMEDTFTATLPLLDRKRGISCWAIGDVKGENLAWAVWHHAGSQIEVKADNGTVLKYKLIAIVEDKIPDNQKVTKIWKTLVYRVEKFYSKSEEIEVLGEFIDKTEAVRVADENYQYSWMRWTHHSITTYRHSIKCNPSTEIRTNRVKTKDKSGKATPTDRILIIAPDSSKPKAFMKAKDLDWKPFHTPKSATLDDFSS